MATRNLHKLSVYNSMQGIVSGMTKEEVTVAFEQKTVTLRRVPFTQYRDGVSGVVLGVREQIPLRLCYAVTGMYMYNYPTSFLYEVES